MMLLFMFGVYSFHEKSREPCCGSVIFPRNLYQIWISVMAQNTHFCKFKLDNN